MWSKATNDIFVLQFTYTSHYLVKVTKNRTLNVFNTHVNLKKTLLSHLFSYLMIIFIFLVNWWNEPHTKGQWSPFLPHLSYTNTKKFFSASQTTAHSYLLRFSLSLSLFFYPTLFNTYLLLFPFTPHMIFIINTLMWENY